MKRCERYEDPTPEVRVRREREAAQPARAARNRAYRLDLAAATSRTARAQHARWTPEDERIVLRDDLTLAEMARRLGRTYQAVANKRYQLLN